MVDLKIAVIGIPGKWSSEVLADALAERTGFRLLVDMADVSLDLSSGQLMAGQTSLSELDAIVVKKISAHYNPSTLDRLELLRMAEHQGLRVFSPAAEIQRLIDRLSGTVSLRRAGVAMPDTVATENPAAALAAVKRFGSAVFKPLYSTKARGMKVLSAAVGDEALRRDVAAFQADNPMMYIQRKLELPGRDLGIAFVGGEYLGSYARVAQGDSWNTTIRGGGRYAACEPDTAILDLAWRAQAVFNLDFTTVDIAETDSGPVVFEVSAFGGFRGIKEAMGIDAAAVYSDYILGELGR